MKLPLVLLALLPRALCGVDAAERPLDVRSERLEAWIESIAAKRQLTKDAVRANVRALTYHLDPGTDYPGPDGGDDPRRDVERRQAILLKDYPDAYGHEVRNNAVTKNRLQPLHVHCRKTNADPVGSPYAPMSANSFWRADGGACVKNTLEFSCKLPNEFGPWGWRQDDQVRPASITCPAGQTCVKFMAYGFALAQPVPWGGCVEMVTADQLRVIQTTKFYSAKYPCPLAPNSVRGWDIYGEAVDGKWIDWAVYTGVDNERVFNTRSPTLLFDGAVQWKGNKPVDRPWLRLERRGETATIRLYEHVF